MEWPSSGFQLAAIHFQRGWEGPCFFASESYEAMFGGGQWQPVGGGKVVWFVKKNLNFIGRRELMNQCAHPTHPRKVLKGKGWLI